MRYLNLSKLFRNFFKTGPSNYYSYRPATRMSWANENPLPMSIIENNSERHSTKYSEEVNLRAEEQILDNRPGIRATALVHEIRNPLMNINLATEMIDVSGQDEEQKTFVAIIARGVERIRELLNDFLLSHRVDEMQPEICSINEIVFEALALNHDRLKFKDVFVIKDFSLRNWKIFVSRKEIVIALTNIIINAVEAMQERTGTLKLKTGIQNDKIVIEIQDNGVGINETNLGKIFNPHYTNKPGGLGLGLSTTRDIILSNHGTVSVKSEPGSGTCFVICFNLTKEDSETVNN